MSASLPVSGWLRRGPFLAAHPELQTLMPNPTSLDWSLRVHRAALAPYLRRHGREVLIHTEAAKVFPELLLKPIK